MKKNKLMFMPIEHDPNVKSEATIYIPERRRKYNKGKHLVMIKQRIGEFEQTIYAPIKKRRNNE